MPFNSTPISVGVPALQNCFVRGFGGFSFSSMFVTSEERIQTYGFLISK